MNFTYFHIILLYLTFSVLGCCRHVSANCDDFFDYQSGSLEGNLSIIIPKEEIQENNFKLEIQFNFPNPLKNDKEIPNISKVGSSSLLHEKITSEDFALFRIKFKRRANIPKIHKVSVGESVICEDDDVGSDEENEIRGKRVNFKLPKNIETRFNETPIEEDDDECGNIKVISGFIKGGKRARQNKWPWVASMFIKNEYACSVNFISRTRAVTAAHCFESNPEPEDIKLRIFTNKDIKVTEYAKHPKYRRIPKYDIAFLETERITDKMFSPICLTNENLDLVGDYGQLLSYAPNNGIETLELLKSEYPVIKNMYCARAFNRKIPKHAFCVRHGIDNTYICQGDSGAGFMIQNDEEKKYYLRGIVSTGTVDINGDCTGKQIIFTKVDSFVNFVQSEE